MENIQQLLNLAPKFLWAACITFGLTLCAVLFGIILGLLLALARLSKFKPTNSLAKFYIWFFRGTPLFMQIFFIYFTLPQMVPFFKNLDAFASGVFALALNSGAYLAEIIRAAIQSIDKGQMEASKALGMSYGQAMRRVIIPQSYRRLLPPVGNEFIALLKDSSLVSTMGIAELMRITTQQASRMANAIAYLPAVILYLMMTTLFTFIFSRLEKKYSVYE